MKIHKSLISQVKLLYALGESKISTIPLVRNGENNSDELVLCSFGDYGLGQSGFNSTTLKDFENLMQLMIESSQTALLQEKYIIEYLVCTLLNRNQSKNYEEMSTKLMKILGKIKSQTSASEFIYNYLKIQKEMQDVKLVNKKFKLSEYENMLTIDDAKISELKIDAYVNFMNARYKHGSDRSEVFLSKSFLIEKLDKLLKNSKNLQEKLSAIFINTDNQITNIYNTFISDCFTRDLFEFTKVLNTYLGFSDEDDFFIGLNDPRFV